MWLVVMKLAWRERENLKASVSAVIQQLQTLLLCTHSLPPNNHLFPQQGPQHTVWTLSSNPPAATAPPAASHPATHPSDTVGDAAGDGRTSPGPFLAVAGGGTRSRAGAVGSSAATRSTARLVRDLSLIRERSTLDPQVCFNVVFKDSLGRVGVGV